MVRSGCVVAPALTKAMYERGQKSARDGPFDVTHVCYDPKRDTLNLTLRKGIGVSLPRAQISELVNIAPSDLSRIEIQPGGDAISFRAVDVDIYVPGLLADELSAMFAGATGRKTRGRGSMEKAASSRENGRKGGRPKKTSPAA